MRYDEKTNSITLSGRHQDAVINIDYDTLKLNWIIGDPTNWSKEYQKYFFKPLGDDFEWQWSQHAAMITPEGYVFILDNGNRLALHSKKVIKASHNIIDLIEVGDYVNGNEIYKISWDSLGLILETTDYFKLREKDIKSILTKEQFESLEYKVD